MYQCLRVFAFLQFLLLQKFQLKDHDGVAGLRDGVFALGGDNELFVVGGECHAHREGFGLDFVNDFHGGVVNDHDFTGVVDAGEGVFAVGGDINGSGAGAHHDGLPVFEIDELLVVEGFLKDSRELGALDGSKFIRTEVNKTIVEHDVS